MKGKNNITLEHRGKVSNGALQLWDLEKYQHDIERHDGCDIRLIIVEDVPNHTTEQMRTFRGHITDCALQAEDFGGWTKQEFQEAMKYQFLRETKDVKQPDGSYKEIERVPSLGDLNIKQMSEFIENVINFLAELEIKVEINSEFRS
jgi:hypothetical protein